MKRIFAILLAVSLLLTLAACGEKKPEGPPEPTEWAITTEFITQKLAEYAASEELQFMLDNHKALADYHGQDKTYGPYLTGAAEVYALHGDGQGYRFILMYLEGDFQLAIDAYSESAAVVYDFDSGMLYDSLNQNRLELKEKYDVLRDTAMYIALNCGSSYEDNLANLPNSFGDDNNPSYIFTRELTAEEVASINDALGLEPVPLRGLEARPELHTTPEERHSRIVDAVKQFAGSELYYKLYPDYDMPLVEAASEVAEEVSLGAHALVIKLTGADTSGGEQDKIVIDMKNDRVFTDPDFDKDWADLNTPEKVTYLLASVYDHVVSGAEEFFWSSGTETNIHLTEEEIEAINKELTAYFEANPIERPTEPPTEPPTEHVMVEESELEVSGQPSQTVSGSVDWPVSEQYLVDTMRKIQQTEDYQLLADDPNVIRLDGAYEYYLENFEGMEVHLLMLRLGGIDKDIHGFSGDVFLVDLATGEIYSNFNVPLDGWDPFTGILDACEAILSSMFWEDETIVPIWADMETIAAVPETALKAVNIALIG